MTPAELKSYQDGYIDRANYEAWLHGVYTFRALISIAGLILNKNDSNKEITEYPTSPIPELQSDFDESKIEEKKKQEAEYERLKTIEFFKRLAEMSKNSKKESSS